MASADASPDDPSVKDIVVESAPVDELGGVRNLWQVGPIAWVQDLCTVQGTKFIVMIFCIECLIKGFSKSLSDQTQFFLFQQEHVSAGRMQIYDGITTLPWVIKPIYAILSDMFPILGYHKNPYILIALLIGVTGSSIVAAHRTRGGDIDVVVICLFALEVCFSLSDLLTQAAYSTKIRLTPASGPDLITFIGMGQLFFALMGIGTSALALTFLTPQMSYLILIIPLIICVWPTAANYLQEVPVSSADAVVQRRKVLAQWELMLISAVMLVISIVLLISGITVHSYLVNFILAIVSFIIVVVINAIFLRPIIAKVMVFYVVQATMFVSISSAATYFYTDTPREYPDGPHFTKAFVTVGLGSVALVCSLLALLLYNAFMKEWKYRSLLIITNVVQVFFSALDVVFFLRLNRKLGIPDVAFVLGSSVFQTVIRAWALLPGVVLTSHLCPAGFEAILFALLAGAHNAGTTFSKYIGAYMMDCLEIHPQAMPHESRQFKNLWIAALISCLLPLVSIALIPFTIPNSKQTESLLSDTDDACKGSLWQRWRGVQENPQDDFYGTFNEDSEPLTSGNDQSG